jgi:transcription antitermination factor NusG
MKRLVLLKVVRNPDTYDVAIDAIQIGDKITLDSGPFSAQAIVREVNKTHYVLVLASLAF